MEGLHVNGRRILNWVLKRNRLGGRELDYSSSSSFIAVTTHYGF
jgi:hypothetical protein